jgi:2-iminobutanoate/2-iminopropanoate deaminase
VVSETGKRAIRSPRAPSGTGPYSPALVAGDYVFVSGQAALDPETHQVRGETVAEQTRATLENVGALLEAAGASFRGVVRVNAYLSSIDDFDEYNAAYEQVFSAEPRPTRTTVGAALGPGLLVEIDCIAYVARD